MWHPSLGNVAPVFMGQVLPRIGAVLISYDVPVIAAIGYSAALGNRMMNCLGRYGGGTRVKLSVSVSECRQNFT